MRAAARWPQRGSVASASPSSAKSRSRKKFRKVRITAIAPSCPTSCQVGAIEVSMMSAASWNVRPATSQRPYRTRISRNRRCAAGAGNAAHNPVANASTVPMATTINAIASIMTTTSFVTRCSHSSIGGASLDPQRTAAGDSSGRPLTGSSGLRVGAFLYLPEYLVEVEAGGLLALRILPEGLQELPDKSLRWHHQVDVVDQPIPI